MHNNYYFLRQVSTQLNKRIIGYSIVSCFSQNKDELIIELNDSRQSFFIKANVSPAFSCLSFPKNFHRARKNSVDLFNDVLLKKVISVGQFENERSFSIELEDHLSMIFKMHNNMANVLFLKEGKVKEIFRNNLESDYEMAAEKLNRSIDFSKQKFLESTPPLASVYFTFGKLVWEYLEERRFSQRESEDRWRVFEQTLSLLENPAYYLIERKVN